MLIYHIRHSSQYLQCISKFCTHGYALGLYIMPSLYRDNGETNLSCYQRDCLILMGCEHTDGHLTVRTSSGNYVINRWPRKGYRKKIYCGPNLWIRCESYRPLGFRNRHNFRGDFVQWEIWARKSRMNLCNSVTKKVRLISFIFIIELQCYRGYMLIKVYNRTLL